MTDLEELKTLLRETYIDTGMVLLKTAQDAIEQLQFTIARQARAAKMGMDAAKSSAQAMLTEANRARAESSPDALASERAANAALTDQIERLQRELEEARRLLCEARENLYSMTDPALISRIDAAILEGAKS